MRPAASASEAIESFYRQVSEQVQDLIKKLDAAVQRRAANSMHDFQEVMEELYLGMIALAEDADYAKLNGISDLCCGVKDLLQRLLDQPSNWSSNMNQTIASAMGLIVDLCAARAGAPGAFSAVRLLVVDDDLLTRRALSGCLEQGFGRPETAASAEAAIQLSKEKAYDLILLDVFMPGFDGFEACERILETTVNRHTPVIFVTMNDNEAARSQAAKSGGRSFIPKPIVPTQVRLAALTLVLRKRFREASAPLAQSATLSSTALVDQ
jgi:CheY-like chemotaxis protein